MNLCTRSWLLAGLAGTIAATLLLASACDEDETPSETPPSAETAAGEASPAAEPPEEATPSASSMSQASGSEAATERQPRRAPQRITKADGRAYRGAVNRARAQAQRDPAAALAAFEALVADHSDDPRLHCEAGYLAHRSGDADKARRLIERARTLFGNFPPPEMKPYAAMCHFNRGMVLEAAGDPRGARYAYRTSLRMRPNDTVERRLLALPAEEEELKIVEATSLEAIGAALEEEYEVDPDAGDLDETGNRDWDAILGVEFTIMARRPGSDGVPELALLQIGAEDTLSIEQTVRVAVATEGGYALLSVAEDTDDMTDHGATSMVGFGGGAIELIDSSAGPIAKMTFHHNHVGGANGCDDDCCYDWGYEIDDDLVVLCTFEPIRCRSISLVASHTQDSSSDCEEGDDEGGEESSWLPNHTRTLTIDPDGMTHLRDVSGSPPRGAPTAGDRPAVDLLRITPR